MTRQLQAPYASLCFLSFMRPTFIFEAIQTAIQHAGYPCEVIVHDDGSHDDKLTTELADWVREGKISELIMHPFFHNEGVGRAVNRMFAIASGDPLIKLDQDLIFEPGWLETLIEIVQDERVGMAGLFKYHHAPVVWGEQMTEVFETYHYTRQFCGSGFAIPRDVYADLGPLDEHSDAFAEDSIYMTKVRKSLVHKNIDTIYRELALPNTDLCRNRGFGFGPSTVCLEPDKVQSIKHGPLIFNDVGEAEPSPTPEAGVRDHGPGEVGNSSTLSDSGGRRPRDEPSDSAAHVIEGDELRARLEAMQEMEEEAPEERKFDVAVVITTCEGREENLKRTLDHLRGLSARSTANGERKPTGIYVVFDGNEAPDWMVDADMLTQCPVRWTEIPKHEPGHEQPRNVGFREARSLWPEVNFVWFLDSDMVFESDILDRYYEALCQAEDRVLIGPYDWMPPNETAPMHGLFNDGRRQDGFDIYESDKVFTYDVGCGLACFGGNLIWPVEPFEHIGGFHPDMHHGRCEDGEHGVRACSYGIPMSLVEAARCWHVYHEIDFNRANVANVRDVPLLDGWHPWIQDGSIKEAWLEKAKAGEVRFVFHCPECGEEVHNTAYWDHMTDHRSDHTLEPKLRELVKAVEETGFWQDPLDRSWSEPAPVTSHQTFRPDRFLYGHELRDSGVLQEVNRLLLHPLGLALTLAIKESGEEELRIADCREDPEGVAFHPGVLNEDKARRVANEVERRGEKRAESLGFVVQPLDPEVKQLHVTVREVTMQAIPAE